MKNSMLIIVALLFLSPVLAFAANTNCQLGIHDGLPCVLEPASQTHSQEEFVIITVKNIKKNKGQIRIRIWDSQEAYDNKETQPTNRACSYEAKDVVDKQMRFKMGGFERNKKYAFFAHHDKNMDNIVNRRLKIPTEPYMFSNAANQGKGPGLTREGHQAPSFESTAILYTGPGQNVVLPL